MAGESLPAESELDTKRPQRDSRSIARLRQASVPLKSPATLSTPEDIHVCLCLITETCVSYVGLYLGISWGISMARILKRI